MNLSKIFQHCKQGQTHVKSNGVIGPRWDLKSPQIFDEPLAHAPVDPTCSIPFIPKPFPFKTLPFPLPQTPNPLQLQGLLLDEIPALPFKLRRSSSPAPKLQHRRVKRTREVWFDRLKLPPSQTLDQLSIW